MEKIVGLGEVLWDIFQKKKTLGGAVTNFAIHANSLGMDGTVVSAVGSDSLGDRVKKEFLSHGLKTYLNQSDYPTGTVYVELDNEGKATYEITKDSAWDYITLTEESKNLAKECDVVCFGTLAQRTATSRNSIKTFLNLTPKDCIKIFDINIRQDFYSKEIIESSLNMATVLKINDEELPLLIEMFNLPTVELETLESLKKQFNLDLIVLTKGDKGSTLFKSKNEYSTRKPKKISVVDTVGAGDSFTAVVAIGLMQKLSLDKINENANKIAAFVCTQRGATPNLKGFIVE